MLSVIWTAMVTFSLAAGLFTGAAETLAAAAMEGAGAAVETALALAGPLCLWMGLSRVMEKSGITRALTRLLRPALVRIFPQAAADDQAMGSLCGNVAANLLGLGNAATPLGISAARELHRLSGGGDTASHELCRLIVLNTASLQLLPTTVAALRASLGSSAPFSILPAVLLTSLFSVSCGLTAAWLFAGRRGHG